MSAFGEPHIELDQTDSTNDRARLLAEEGAANGTVITAASQSSGRGRYGRPWSAPPGKALLFSAILRPLRAEHALLPIAVAVAVCEAVESLAELRCEIKWPNDIWVEQRKLAGVLIEARPPEWAVIGVGINVAIEPDEFPDDLRWPAISIASGVSVDETRGALCRALDRWTEATADQAVGAFRERDALRGRAIEWEEGSGEAAGIADNGNLLINRADGEQVSLGSGEVSLRLVGS